MAIARVLGTAGEGQSRPSQTDLSTDSTNLPWVILRAAHRAAQLDGVPARARAVLAALARTVDGAKPFGEIFARRTLLTERAMQSERTFYRSLTDLETAGLIDRRPQRRYVEAGLFGRAYLHLTEKAAVLLGLVEAPEAASDKPATEAAAQGPKGFAQPSDSVADGANTKDLIPTAFQKRQPGEFSTKKAGQPPEDLQRLRTIGFTDFLIFKLMREAREAGKRLSEVVEVCWGSLRKATYPISYLKALIASPTDFGHQLRARHAEETAARDAAHAKRDAARELAQLDGQSFMDASGAQRYVLSEGGACLTVYRSDEDIARRVGGEWAVEFLQLIKKGHINKINPAVQPSRPTAAPAHDETPRQLTRDVAAHLAALKTLCGVRVKHG
jgi:DNA-binding transcriptional ArsR family regulator